MKTYEFTLKHDSGTCAIRIREESFDKAKRRVLELERAPERAIQSWRVVPDARAIRKTQSLLRCI